MIDRAGTRAAVYRTLNQAAGAARPTTAPELSALLGAPVLLVHLVLEELRVVGFVIQVGEDGWAITEEGERAMQRPAFDMPVNDDDNSQPTLPAA